MIRTRNEIRRILHICIDELLTRDSCLLENDVSERAITHKLAEYLQQQIPDLNVDCEYNRNTTRGEQAPKEVQMRVQSTKGDLSTLDADDTISLSAFPDIIVHRRMTNKKNLLVVEVKKKKSQVNHDYDHRKLTAFTENTPRNDYHFSYGVFILLDTGHSKPDEPTLTWFAKGKKVV